MQKKKFFRFFFHRFKRIFMNQTIRKVDHRSNFGIRDIRTGSRKSTRQQAKKKQNLAYVESNIVDSRIYMSIVSDRKDDCNRGKKL